MGANVYQFIPLLAHSEHSSAVKMPFSVWRAFNTEKEGESYYVTAKREQTLYTRVVSYLYVQSDVTLTRTEEAWDQYMDKGVPCPPF